MSNDAFRREGLGGPAQLHKREECQEEQEESDRGEREDIAPGEVAAAVETEEKEEYGEDEGKGTGEVDASNFGLEVGGVGAGEVEREEDRNEGEDDEGDLDEETPGKRYSCWDRLESNTHHRQQMVSDKTPPRGAPDAEPDA